MFGLNKTPEVSPAQKIKDLQGESDAIVGFVHDTINGLQTVNEEIARQKEAVENQINELVLARTAAGQQLEANKSIAEKFKSFLND